MNKKQKSFYGKSEAEKLIPVFKLRNYLLNKKLDEKIEKIKQKANSN